MSLFRPEGATNEKENAYSPRKRGNMSRRRLLLSYGNGWADRHRWLDGGFEDSSIRWLPESLQLVPDYPESDSLRRRLRARGRSGGRGVEDTPPGFSCHFGHFDVEGFLQITHPFNRPLVFFLSSMPVMVDMTFGFLPQVEGFVWPSCRAL